MRAQGLKLILGLALAGMLLPTTGCKFKRGGSRGGSSTNVFVGLDWFPTFGGFGFFDDYTYYEEDVYVYEDESYYVDDYYYEDEYYVDDYVDDVYWDDGYYYDDDWKRKRAGKRR